MAIRPSQPLRHASRNSASPSRLRCGVRRTGPPKVSARRSRPLRERDATWVEPQLVAQVGFTEWTRDGRLRHPRFLGLREDKAAEEVVRE